MVSLPFMLHRTTACSLGSALLLSISGCGVYVPTLGPIAMVQQRGQVEVGGIYRPLTMGEIYAVYSPAKHLLVAGSAAKLWNPLGHDTDATFRQVDIGLGYYTTLGHRQRWYVSALGGYGYARSDWRYEAQGTSSPIKEYMARYNPTYGQVQFAFQYEGWAIGTALRLTGLHYTQLTLNGQAPTEPVGDLYLGTYWFARLGRGPVQLHVQAGASRPLPGAAQGKEYDLNTSSPVFGLGIVLRPHLLRQQGQAPQQP